MMPTLHASYLPAMASLLPPPPVLEDLLLAELHVGMEFNTLEEARMAIKRAITDAGESFKVEKADRFCWVAVCKDKDCPFKIRVKNGTKATISVLHHHTCSPVTHVDNRYAYSMEYLLPHHLAGVFNN